MVTHKFYFCIFANQSTHQFFCFTKCNILNFSTFLNLVKNIPKSQLQIWLSFLFNKCWIWNLWSLSCGGACGMLLNKTHLPFRGENVSNKDFIQIWITLCLAHVGYWYQKLLKTWNDTIKMLSKYYNQNKFIFQPPYLFWKKNRFRPNIRYWLA